MQDFSTRKRSGMRRKGDKAKSLAYLIGGAFWSWGVPSGGGGRGA
jgi:hypothetical protein